MDPRIRSTFLALVLTQIAHSVEEYIFRFYEVSPPARLLDELVPGLTRPGFIIFNALLALFGLCCFFFNVFGLFRLLRFISRLVRTFFRGFVFT